MVTKKRAGNSNFIGGATIEVAVWVCTLAVSGDQVLPGVTRCCQVRPDVARSDQMLPGVTRYSVLLWQRRQEKCFGAAGMSRKVFWHSGSGKKSVVGMPSQDQYGGRL